MHFVQVCCTGCHQQNRNKKKKIQLHDFWTGKIHQEVLHTANVEEVTYKICEKNSQQHNARIWSTPLNIFTLITIFFLSSKKHKKEFASLELHHLKGQNTQQNTVLFLSNNWCVLLGKHPIINWIGTHWVRCHLTQAATIQICGSQNRCRKTSNYTQRNVRQHRK